MSQSIFIGLLFLQIVWLCLIFAAFYDLAVATARLDCLLAFCCAFLLFELAGYLAFWLAYANVMAFIVVKTPALTALAVRVDRLQAQARQASANHRRAVALQLAISGLAVPESYFVAILFFCREQRVATA
jgi:hypothetical protein